ncbi:MAG: tetratricopeptide repeat protein [Deltaproteobacteria bacterium]|nr:tetratricopeptide repeat protein [Deltaproteobacteria bacterium]
MRISFCRMGLAWILWSCAGTSPERATAEKAAKKEEPARAASPQEIAAWRERGLKQLEEGDYRGARDELKKAWSGGAKDWELALALGEASLFVDDEASAQASLRHAVEVAPENPRAHVLHAVAESLPGGNAELRVRAGKRAAELRADILDALLEDAERLEAAKAKKATVAALEVATMIAPTELRAQVRLSAALNGDGRFREAAIALETAARATSKSAVMFRQAAELWTKAGDETKAAELRKIADELDPPETERKMRPLLESKRK